MAPLHLRPHHILCAIGFEGKGYSDDFTANMARLVAQLRAPGGDGQMIQIAPAADDICGPCPLRRGALCASQAKINRLDADHSAALGIAPGETLSWGAAQERARAKVAPGDLARLCAGCQWLELGICERALARLHEKGAAPDGPGA